MKTRRDLDSLASVCPPTRPGILVWAAGLWFALSAVPAQGRNVEEVYFYDYENYGSCWDSPGSLVPIGVAHCDGALKGLAVTGMDAAGEWVQVPLRLSGDATFTDSLRSAGEVDYVRHFVVQFVDAFTQEPILEDTLTTIPGLGVE